jgi:hypothetical protein
MRHSAKSAPRMASAHGRKTRLRPGTAPTRHYVPTAALRRATAVSRRATAVPRRATVVSRQASAHGRKTRHRPGTTPHYVPTAAPRPATAVSRRASAHGRKTRHRPGAASTCRGPTPACGVHQVFARWNQIRVGSHQLTYVRADKFIH